MSRKIILEPGSRYGRLTVIRYDGSHKKPCGSSQGKHLCRCDCGNIVSVLTQNLRNGNTKSCGCLSAEAHKKRMLPDNRGVINQIILGYKRHASDRGFTWDLDYEEVKTIISLPCYYCGAKLTNCKITKNCKDGFYYNGIDRIDNTKDYVYENVVPCCSQCNYAKRNLSCKDFIQWIQRAADYTKVIAQLWG